MNIKYTLAVLAIGSYTATNAQTDTSKHLTLNEFVLSANKFAENKKNVAQQIKRIDKKEITWAMPQTTATLLEQNGGVFVQRSQAGGGSVVLRGFEASRTLMIVDGVRMNNAIYRAGHLQNIITVDNNILDNVEIMYGPASTVHGSDALGGAVLMNTISPSLAENGRSQFNANVMTRYSSANNEGTGHVHFNLGFRKIAFLTSVTYSKFGDLRQGSHSNPFYGSFGMRNEYVERINGVDSIITNPDPHVQKYSGYSQVDLLEKISFKQNDHICHNLNLQFSNSSNVPRYDRLTDIRTGKLRYAEWYYGPQQRAMTAYTLNATGLKGFVNEIVAGVNYQAIEESRHQRSRGSNALQSRTENVDVIGYNVDFRKMMKRHEITFGTDGQYNKVRSTAKEVDIVTSKEKSLDTRYPDGGSTMYYGALYAAHIFKFNHNKLVLNDGIRLIYVSLNSKFNDTTFFPFPFKTASQNNTAVSGNLGLAYMPFERWRFAVNGSTGFRSPNVDDMAKVFESAAGASLFVPNPNLKPEYTYNLDLGVTYIVNDVLKIEATGFYTWFKDAIIADKFTLNGKDSVMYNGKMTAVMASQNKAKAYIYGFNASLSARLGMGVTFYSTVTSTYGRYVNAAVVEVPLDHIPPVFGKTSLMYEHNKFMTEAYALYNGWKYLKDYSPSGEDNLTYATAQGMPSWYTINVRAGYKFNPNLSVQLALENILDQNYRTFSSGISSPGRNFVVTLRGNL
jgi:hemoglobin/transferrin/lactoferrin receptor protein